MYEDVTLRAALEEILAEIRPELPCSQWALTEEARLLRKMDRIAKTATAALKQTDPCAGCVEQQLEGECSHACGHDEQGRELPETDEHSKQDKPLPIHIYCGSTLERWPFMWQFRAFQSDGTLLAGKVGAIDEDLPQTQLTAEFVAVQQALSWAAEDDLSRVTIHTASEGVVRVTSFLLRADHFGGLYFLAQDCRRLACLVSDPDGEVDFVWDNLGLVGAKLGEAG